MTLSSEKDRKPVVGICLEFGAGIKSEGVFCCALFFSYGIFEYFIFKYSNPFVPWHVPERCALTSAPKAALLRLCNRDRCWAELGCRAASVSGWRGAVGAGRDPETKGC